jgi:uncharacterized phage protein (TIGR02218 family)
MKTATDQFINKERSSIRRPAELYHLWRDGGQHWRYTSGDIDIVYGGETYKTASIKRGPVSASASLEVTTLEIMSAAITDPTADFIASNPVEPLWVEVLKVHRADPNDAIVIFIGQIKSVVFRGVEAAARCVGFENFLNQPIPLYRYQPSCNNRLFDSKCTIVATSYKVDTTITMVDTLTFTSSAFATKSDGWFTRGNLVCGEFERMITYHSGNTIAIRYPINGIATGASIVAYAGCDLSIETCRDRFSNVLNFFGHPFVPKDNPATKY